jgi:uncharacterized DUF497 family protein
MNFEWDEQKNKDNQEKHHLSFEEAQYAFFDPKRIILQDIKHSSNEKRYFCIGDTGNGIATVRFTHRQESIRIIGAGYWREGRKDYEKKNRV